MNLQINRINKCKMKKQMKKKRYQKRKIKNQNKKKRANFMAKSQKKCSIWSNSKIYAIERLAGLMRVTFLSSIAFNASKS
jgi:hypothetical protein